MRFGCPSASSSRNHNITESAALCRQFLKGDRRWTILFQDQLAVKGITKEMLDMDNFAGLTARELQNIVNSARLIKKGATAGEPASA